jgi:hypothetical protein
MIIIYKSGLAASVSMRASARDGDQAASDDEAAMRSPVAGDTSLTHPLQSGQFNSFNN